MNELPDNRKAINGFAQHEIYDHAHGSVRPDGPYRRVSHRIVSWIIGWLVGFLILFIIGLLS